MSKTVYMSSDTPISDEVREELRRIALMPDSEINTTDIPETTPEQFARMRERRKTQLEQPALTHKKAS